MKKTVIALTAAFVMILGAFSVSYANMPEIPQEYIDAAKKEAPLNQGDIDNFIKLWPELQKSDKGSYTEAESIALFEKYGFPKYRGPFVLLKITNARVLSGLPAEHLEMAKGMLLSQKMPSVYMPSDSELALVAKNKAALDKIGYANMN